MAKGGALHKNKSITVLHFFGSEFLINLCWLKKTTSKFDNVFIKETNFELKRFFRSRKVGFELPTIPENI